MPGNITKRGENSYRLRVTIGTDFQGKPIVYSKTVKCKTEAAAKKELAKFYAECESGKVNKSNPITISQLAATYLEEYAQRHLKKSAQVSANTAVKLHIDPSIGSKKVIKLARIDVQQWVNHLSDKGLAPKTVRNYYSTLSGIMQFAIDMNIIEDTPCKNIRLPKDKKKKEVDYYTIDEVKKLLYALDELPEEETHYKAAIYIALFGGLRKSEILGLNWDDINFRTGELRIHRSRMYAPGTGTYEDTPKTDKSNRIVTLPAEVVYILQDLQLQQKYRQLAAGPNYKESNAAIRSSTGNPLHPSVLYRWWAAFLKKNSLRHIPLHSLRHTHASMLAHLGEDKVKVSSRLGHSQLSTTLNIYTHLFEKTDKAIADNLSDAFL